MWSTATGAESADGSTTPPPVFQLERNQLDLSLESTSEQKRYTTKEKTAQIAVTSAIRMRVLSTSQLSTNQSPTPSYHETPMSHRWNAGYSRRHPTGKDVEFQPTDKLQRQIPVA